MKNFKKRVCLLLSVVFLTAGACKKSDTSTPEDPNDPSLPVSPVNPSNPADPGKNDGENRKYDDGINEGKDFLGEENGYFVKGGKSEYAIVIPENATGSEKNSAEEIQRYVRVVTGATLSLTVDTGKTYNSADKVISVGKTVYCKQSSVSQNVDYETLKTGGYYVKNDGKVYLLDSAVNEGVVYAGYEFLSTFFGVEFLTADYTYTPKYEDVKAYKIDYTTIPAFALRDYYAYSVWFQGEGFGAKLRMNSPSYKSTDAVSGKNDYDYYGYYYDKEDLSKFPQREGHTIQYLLMADAYANGYIPNYNYTTTDYGASKWFPLGYFGQKPDWYAYDSTYERSNSRGYSQEEVCYTNGLDDNGDWIEQSPDVSLEEMSLVTKMIEICVKMVTEEVSESAKYLMLGQADYGHCKCVRCKAAEAKFGGFGGLNSVWTNAVVKETKKRLASIGCTRKVKFVKFAYQKSIDAPVTKNAQGEIVPVSDKVILDDDIIVKMAYRNCVYHSLWDETCEENEIKRNDFRGWEKCAKTFEIWDYSCVFPKYLYYLPNLGAVRDNYLYYSERNVEHVLTQGCPGEYNFYEANLHQWVCCELLWDPTQNVNSLIHRFNTLYFGEKYAGYIDLYRDIYENYFAIRDIEDVGGYHASTDYSLDETNPSSYSYAVLNKAANVVQEAIDKVNDDSDLTNVEKENLVKRLRSVKVTPQFMMLDLGYITDDQIKLDVAKDFFESIDLLKLTYASEGTNAPFSEMRKMYLEK